MHPFRPTGHHFCDAVHENDVAAMFLAKYIIINRPFWQFMAQLKIDLQFMYR